MQVLTQLPKASLSSQSNTRRNKNKPPVLLFLHGSFHGAWCWSEHWFGHFCDLGYPVAALSWRGTGGTPAGTGVRRVPIGQHVRDLRTVLSSLPSLVFGQNRANEERDRGVVLIAHSFGGITVMKLLEAHPEMLLESGAVTDPFPPIRGIAMLCSVPPSGNAAMTARYLRRSLKLSWRITAGFALKRCCTDPDLCRFLFFGGKDEDPEAGTVADEELARYMSYFERDSEATIDLLDLSRRLPSKAADRRSGRAPYHESLPPCLVLGGADDVIVDREGFDETARYFDIGPTGDAPSGPDRIVVKIDSPRQLKEPARYTGIYLAMVDSPHDVMLGRTWREGARVVGDWLLRCEL
jgi:pimeloyl-ACP methyl ester carboxylesterase